MRILFTLALMFLAAQPQQVITARRRVVASAGCSALPFTDSMTRANAATLGSCYTETASPNNIQIISNAATMSTFQGGSILLAAALVTCASCTPGSNPIVQATYTGSGAPYGTLILRAVDVSDYEYAYISTGTIALFHNVGGTSTYVNSYTGAVATGDTVEFCAVGSNYTLYDVTTSSNKGTISDATYSAAGYAGIGMETNQSPPAAWTNLTVKNGSGSCP